MTPRKFVVVVVGLVGFVSASAVTVSAGTPFGGDDPGFVPPDKVTAKCEDKLEQLRCKLFGCVFKCHQKAADAAFNHVIPPFNEDGCETTCLNQALAGLTLLHCPACVNGTTVLTNDVAQLDATLGLTYCDGVPPLIDTTGDDPGAYVPTSAANLRCEDAILKLRAVAMTAACKCHKSKTLTFAPASEEACENKAIVKAFQGYSKLFAANPQHGSVCQQSTSMNPNCPTGGAFGVDASYVENTCGQVYACSPSGAFLDSPAAGF